MLDYWMPYTPPNSTINGIAVVSGIKGAQNAMTPSGKTLLMDADEPIFYIRTYANGTATVDAYRFEKIEPETPTMNTISRDEIKSIIQEVLNESTSEQAASTD